MTSFIFSAFIMVLCFILLGTITSKKVVDSSDYSIAGRKAGTSQVAGVFLGALAGGATTVGTVQMAYEYGISALWFTLGGGIGCLILGIWLARPLRRSGLTTIPQFLKQIYGVPVSFLSLFSTSLGTFISIVAQFLAGIALFRTILPISEEMASGIFAFLILAFIYLGGLKSYSVIGKAKTCLLYIIMLVCVALVWIKGHSISFLIRDLSFYPYFDPFWGGIGKNISSLMSISIGIMCTQIFVQGVFAASDEESARKGVLVSSLVLPTMGFLGVLIGLAMRHANISVEAAQALPFFVTQYFHPIIGGTFWAGILIAIVGTASGLTLGIATNLINDLALRFIPEISEMAILSLSRISVFIIVILAAIISSKSHGSLILSWSFLSMGLRGAGTFFPFLIAILFPGRLSKMWAIISSAGGLLTLFLIPILHLPVYPLFGALSFSGIAAFIGFVGGKRNISRV